MHPEVDSHAPAGKRRGTCRWVVAAAVAAVSVGRAALRCPVHSQPPDTAIRPGVEGWEAQLRQNLAVHGYSHVVGLLNHSEVAGLRSLAQDYCYGKERKALPLGYGGYSVPNFLSVPEFAEAQWLAEDPRLHQVLRASFGGPDYRFASHNDVGCDFVGVWHKDILRGNVADYQECDVWSPDGLGEQHEVYKVMFYLQNHTHDEQAMKVIPGSHLLRRTPWEQGYVAVHPTMGDAVIFDQRLSHSGNTFFNPLATGRLFMQVGFGRKNRFTDEFERGTVERQRSLHERMLKLQDSPRSWPSTFLTELKFLVVSAAISAVPPQAANYFADAKAIRRLAERSCEGSGGSASRQ